ncbi:DUF3618 domain-containing protein [Microbacterium sp. 179-I 3D4 NHS]|uniref:DUF3618 domain-containing protein n=1 Tax=Microbacterium sp. 179-I 3D4 NHS TaxID=3142381 RepID=UPI0039A31C40
MTDSPEALRAEIERTRNELGRDTDALVDKVTPSKIVDRQKGKLKNALGSVRDRVMGVADDAGSAIGGAGSSIGGAGSHAAEGVGNAAHRVAAKAEGNPLAVGLIAFGAGLLAASLMPASEKEKDLAAGVKEQAQPLVEEAKSVAQDIGSNLQEPVKEAVQNVKDTASDAAAHVTSDVKEATGQVTDRAQEARDNVADS